LPCSATLLISVRHTRAIDRTHFSIARAMHSPQLGSNYAVAATNLPPDAPCGAQPRDAEPCDAARAMCINQNLRRLWHTHYIFHLEPRAENNFNCNNNAVDAHMDNLNPTCGQCSSHFET
jgi:hypothetical protein